jgi:hypothetical protein
MGVCKIKLVESIRLRGLSLGNTTLHFVKDWTSVARDTWNDGGILLYFYFLLCLLIEIFQRLLIYPLKWLKHSRGAFQLNFFDCLLHIFVKFFNILVLFRESLWLHFNFRNCYTFILVHLALNPAVDDWGLLQLAWVQTHHVWGQTGIELLWLELPRRVLFFTAQVRA